MQKVKALYRELDLEKVIYYYFRYEILSLLSIVLTHDIAKPVIVSTIANVMGNARVCVS